MTDIYVVTEGEYSDYHVIGIYDDQELAQMVVDASKYAEIEVRPLNPGADQLRQYLRMFGVSMDANGDRARADLEHGVVEEEFTMFRKPPAFRNPPTHLFGRCWARDKPHAIKIINEKRLIALASPGD